MKKFKLILGQKIKERFLNERNGTVIRFIDQKFHDNKVHWYSNEQVSIQISKNRPSCAFCEMEKKINEKKNETSSSDIDFSSHT